MGIGQKWQIHTRRRHGAWNKPVVKRQRLPDPIYVRYLEGPKSQRDGRYRGCHSGVGEGTWGLKVSRVLSFSFARGKNSGMSSRDWWCGWCWWSRSVNGFHVPESCASNWLRWYPLRYMCVFYCNQNKTEQNATPRPKLRVIALMKMNRAMAPGVSKRRREHAPSGEARGNLGGTASSELLQQEPSERQDKRGWSFWDAARCGNQEGWPVTTGATVTLWTRVRY